LVWQGNGWQGNGPLNLTSILAGRRAVTADTGLRLNRYFGLSEGYWLGLQQKYDLRQAKRLFANELAKIKRVFQRPFPSTLQAPSATGSLREKSG
jgi:plasmid maintenance system antidote protein VapI